ncbi:DMT family transporter [Pseudooceanicola sp. LIPI14-2-Ac024]|uniref:DMT family transporter n=1 Tax=Pseudooceanicola sp. LIPI14-2-Ac024 TaxID=3344875 RepID=UPI0035D0B5CB
MSDFAKGILLMVVAMFGLALSDMFVKLASASLPPAQLILMVGGGTSVVYAVVAIALRMPLFSPLFFKPLILLRTCAEAMVGVAGMTALSLVPLSTVTAITQCTPLLVTLGAAVFLKEHVGWRRWLAIGVGMIAMLMIVRPGGQGFEAPVLLAVVAAVGLAVRDLATRAAPQHIPSLVLAAWGFSGAVVAGLVLLPFGPPPQMPTGSVWAYVVCGVAVTALGYYALTASVRIGDISVVAPFRYARLVFAMIIAVVVLHERPDAWTIAGSVLIVASGLYTFLRERKVARAMVNVAGAGPVGRA